MGLRPASRVRPEESSDGQERPGRRPRFLPESLATEHDYGSPMSPGAASHRGPGTVPVQQTQQASSPHAPAGSAGGEGESSSAPPGYAEFVASAVRSAMEPFLQNVAQVVGEQTAQIAQVSQRVDQLAGVVSQLSLNQASQVPVGGSPPRPPHGSPSPPRSFESSSGLSSLSGFGERPVVPPVRNFGVPGTTPDGVPLHEGPGVAASRAEEREKDVFTRSEKWLPAMPLPGFSKWSKSRQEEILCFAEYMNQFKSWIALASDTFAFEIESAIRHPEELHMGGLKPAQQVRASRLLAMLQQIFTPYPRASMLLQAYVEGIGVDGIFVEHRGTSGFEALRLLGKEFSLRTRAEAAFFRAEVLKKTYKAENSATQISDVVRRMDVDLSRYRKLVGTLPLTATKDGLDVASADLTLILLRSLPGECRAYCMLHAKDETFQELRAAALRFESQQRLFLELGGAMPGGGRGHGVFQVQEELEGQEDEYPEDQWIDAVGKGTKCNKCGKAGHYAKECPTDMTKVKCFKCGQDGHIGANCRSASGKAKAKPLAKPKPKAHSKGSPRKAQGKGKGKGKKGKLNEVGEAEEGAEEPEEEWPEGEEAEEEWAEESATVSGVLMMPLFVGSVEEASDGWMYWLLDSGAACSVLSESHKQHYKRVSRGREVSGRYLAANGTPVTMGERVSASVMFCVERPDGTQDAQEFQLECNVGQTAHNIISTTQLMKKGWTFVQSNSGSFLIHEPTKIFIGEVLYWGSCPWIRVSSDAKAGVPVARAKKAIQAVVSGDGVVQESAEVTRHILRGHYPYDPNCLECAQGRGVGRSPRRPKRERILEIQVDFFFLGSVSSKHKFIVMRQVLTGLLGATAVTPNLQVTAQHIRQILAEFGVTGSDGPPIDIRTDAATDVGELLRRSAINREFTVSRAGPQEHNVVGSAERGVREIKEVISVARLELAKRQLDVVDSMVGWDGICRYVVAMHNLHGKKFGKTPREMLRESPASSENPVSAMFCSQVLAETPESVPSIGRFVTAAYLWPVRNSFAHFVVAMIENELKYFQAKSLKLVLPLVFPPDLIQRFVVSTEGVPRMIEDKSPVEVVPSDFMKLPGRVPPPKSWVDAEGKTPGCKACDSGKGKHSVACQTRYSKWLESHHASGAKVGVPSPAGAVPEPPLLDDQQEVAGEGSDYSPTTPPGSDGEGAAVAQEREKRRKVQESSSPDPFYTRHCPACESGMDVPGIRHNAECKKKRASLSVKPAVSGPPALTDAPAGPSVPSGPRASPDYFDDNWDIVPSPEGDAVMADGPPGGEENVPMEYGIIDLNQCGVLAKPSCLSDLHLVSIARLNVESIAYDGSKGEFKVIDFCGGRVKLWKPSHVISDTTLGELDPEGTFKAMQKECDGLTAVRAGVILSEKQKDDFCKRHGVKPITCRWVTNEKPESEEGVRARIVVKDIARGSATARSLAISSPTPSVESLRMVLGAASGSWGVELSLHAIDVSQAFMNSPLRDHERIILRFPLSLSTMSGEPIFIEAHKALNGLRVASLTWSVFLKDIVSKVNLACSTTEPCLYGGVIDGSPTLLLCYVDDLLIASSSDKAFHRVFKELSKHVKVRETGKISLSKEGGGSLKFLGRMISRQSGSPTLVMQVDASYMDGACEEFGIKVPKGVASPPDIKPSLEATVEESPISPEAHSRYRRVLGRLAWLAQTRMDLLHYTSLLASGQSEPRPGHEKALRQVLRFVAADSRVGQHFPISDGEEHHLNEKEVIVYSDAAFAPMRVFERRSISGAVLIYRQVTLKCFSRHQHAVSLSSCEAELHALQSAVQEAIGLARTLLKSLNLRKDLPALEFLEEGEVPLQILLRTDSLSGKQLLESYDLQKKSRHIEIRLCWLRKLLSIGSLELSFVRGDLNLSDMFTKCVGQALFSRFREAIGFATHDLHLSVLVTKSHEETSELFEDLEGKPVGSVSKLIPRICEVFQVREKIKKGPRCILCGDLLSQDFVFDGLHDSAAISGSTGFSLSAVTVTQLLEMSTDSDDDDRRSRREEREEVPRDVDSPKAPGKKRRRKSKLQEESAVAGEAVASEKPEDHEETPADKDAQGTEEVASVPPVKAPPVAPPGAKKDKKFERPVSPEGKPGKGKKGKGKGKGKKGKGKAKETESPWKSPKGKKTDLGAPIPTSREIRDQLEPEVKAKMFVGNTGFSDNDPKAKRYKCHFCRQRGHLSRFCPQVHFRVSLSEGAVVPQQKGAPRVAGGSGDGESADGPPLVTTADPSELPDTALRLVERRAVRANLQKEHEQLQKVEEEAEACIRRERERKQKEQAGRDHEVSKREQKLLEKEAKKAQKKPTKGVQKDKKIVKEKKKEPEETKKAAKKEKVLPVAKFPPEEYSYYTTSEDEKPPPKPKPKAMPKVDGKKRKMPVAATPKKVAKARGRPKKKKAPSPSPSPTPTPSEESLDNGDIQEEEAEEEEEVSPSEMSEVFEAEGAAAVPSSKKEKKKHTRLVDDEEEMSRLMEESRRLVEAQRQIEMERAQLRAELRAKRAEKKAEEEAKREEIRRQEEEDKKLAKKEAKDKENAEKKRLRDQAAEELRKEDESRIAEFRKNQTGYSREFFKSLENPDDPAQRKEFLKLHSEKVAAYQRSLKAQKLKEDLEEMKKKPPGQRLQEQRKIPVETDPWSRPAEFWNQSWKAVTAASLSKGYFHCGSQSCKKSFDNETAYWQHLYSKAGKPGHPSGEIFANWKKESAGEPYVPLLMDPNWESGLQEEKKQAELKAKMAEALQSVSSEDESSESSNDTQESHTVHVTQAVYEDVRSAEGVPAEKVSEEDQKEKEVAKDVEDSKMPSEVGEKEGVEGTGDSKGPDEKEKDKEVDDPKREKDKVDDPEGPPEEAVEGVPSAKVEDPGKVDPKPTEKSVGSAEVHVPPEVPSGTDLPVEESTEAAAISGVLEGDIPTAGITTEGRTVPDPDREVCQGCYGTGMAEAEMNRAIRILRSASLIQVKREVDMNEAVTDEERKGPAKEEPAKRLDAVISQDVSCVKGSRNHVVVELCCSKESEMKQACRKIGLHYVGIHDRLEELSVFQVTMKMLSALVSSDLKSHGKGEKNLSLHLHISLPCTGGSPLLNFSTSQVRQEHVSMFLKLLKHVGRYIDSCKEFDPKVTVTFELPHNNRYWKLCEIREFRNRYGLDFEGIVSCCRTGLRAVRTGRLIGKRYRVVSNSESTSKVLNAKFAKCTCTEEHAAFNEVDWKQTEGYTRRFATVLIRTVLAFRFTAET